MSINADITLKRLVAEISTWANAHDMIQAFGYGKYLETFVSDAARKYPVFVVNCPNYTQDQWYFNYSLEIICLEWVFDDRGNRIPAASDTAQIIADFENTIKESDRWQSFSRMDGDFNSTKVDEYGGDKADGWVATFTLKIKKQSGICNITQLMPTYDFDNAPSPLQCSPVSIYQDDVFLEDVASGGRFDFSTEGADASIEFQGSAVVPVESGGTLNIEVVDSLDAPIGSLTTDTNAIKKVVVTYPACADGNVTVNSAAFDSVASGGSLDVPVEYENGTPVGTIVGGVVEIPDPIAPVTPLNTADIFKTGATSLRTGDDGSLAFGRGVDFSTLDFNNGFGDTNRFTDSLGTQIYASDEVVDWSTWNQVSETVLVYYRVPNANANLTTQLAGQPYTKAGKSDWYICNYKQMNNIQNLGITRDFFNYAPLNIAYTGTSDRLWCSTSDSATVSLYFLNTGTSLASQGSSYKAIVCRTFTLAELGL